MDRRVPLDPEDAAEYRRRFEAAREVMRENGLDALVVGSGPPQVGSSGISVGSHGRFAAPRYHRYLGGFHIWGAESFSPQPVVVVLPLSGEPSLVVRAGTLRTWLVLARAHSWIENVVGTYHDDPAWESSTNWGLSSPELPSDVSRVLRDSGLEQGRIGLTGSWPGIEETIAELPGAIFEQTLKVGEDGVPVDLLEPLVATNSAWEIGRLERAQAAADSAMAAFMDEVADGVAIDSAIAAARYETIKGGSEDTIFEITCGLEDWALWVTPAQPRNAVYRTRDLVTLGLMNSYDGYWIQMPRTWVLGGASPAQQRVFDAARRSLDAIVARIRPGVTGGELWEAGLEPIEAAGFQPRGRLGHSVGFTGVSGPELFSMLPGNEVALDDRVAFVVHPCVWDSSTGIVAQFGDTLVLEGEESRFLSANPLPYDPAER